MDTMNDKIRELQGIMDDYRLKMTNSTGYIKKMERQLNENVSQSDPSNYYRG